MLTLDSLCTMSNILQVIQEMFTLESSQSYQAFSKYPDVSFHLPFVNLLLKYD